MFERLDILLKIKVVESDVAVALKEVRHLVKPKFHFADFATKSATISRFVSRTFVISDCVANFPRAL